MRLLLAVCLLLEAAAFADDARTHYRQGTTFYALGRYADAAIEYEKAYELHPDPALLYNAAQAQRMAGNKGRALLLYQNYLRLYGESAANRAEVQRFISQLKTAIDSEHTATSTPPTNPEVVKSELPSTSLTTVEKPAPEKKPMKPWVWGVIGGAAAVVIGVSLGVGLGLGLSGNKDPSASLGRITW